MDNHPIPQDVTHFQFKLIGELTIKQFGYIAAGGISGWITISIHAALIVKLPIAIIFAGAGLIFAFIPIEGRPADMMLTYLIKALFRPNQYLFQKQGSMMALLEPVLATKGIPVQNTPIATPLPPTPIPSSTMAYQPIVPKEAPLPVPMQPIQIQTPTQVPQNTQPVQQAQPQPIPVMQPPTTPIQTPMPIPIATITQQPSSVENQLTDMLAQKKQLEEQLAKLQQQVNQSQQPITPMQQTPTQVAPTQPKKTPPPPSGKTQLPLASDFPNIIMGTVKDSRGNVLPNILIEVKDPSENPVRAFKTNALGQFASATPLLNGPYTVLLEDTTKTHKFETIQIVVTGDIMQPMEIISFDEREGLRKSLFG